MEWMSGLLLDLEQAFHANRNPARAPQAAAYMKNRFSFYGMEAAVRRSVQKPWLDSLKLVEDRKERWALVAALWEKEAREFQYVAIDWINSWPKRYFHPEDAIPLKQLIEQKSWWDSVDAIASNYLGKWAQLYPKEARETFESWRNADSIWLQRSCLIYQLKYKTNVDIDYLENLIAQMLPNKEFFIQKAIGWSLRQVSKTNPEAVERILAAHPIQGLALREAKKYL